MTRVVLPTSVASDLISCTSRTPLMDENGAVVGFFEPAISRDPELYAWLAKEVTTEELEKAARDGGSISTEQLLAKLHAMDKANASAPGNK